jgi:hypothetical protein
MLSSYFQTYGRRRLKCITEVYHRDVDDDSNSAEVLFGLDPEELLNSAQHEHNEYVKRDSEKPDPEFTSAYMGSRKKVFKKHRRENDGEEREQKACKD